MNKSLRKVGIFGGLFDPPHIGHLIIAQSVLEEFCLNKVLFVPAGNPPHKSDYSSYSIRYKMLKLAIKGNKKFSASNIEAKMSGKTYTIKVVKELKKKMTGLLHLIIGSDQWEEIETWLTPNELFRLCKVIVVPRPHYPINNIGRFSKNVMLSHSPLIEVSSSLIRKKAGQNADIQYFVPASVLKYIKRKRLYR